MDYRVIDPKGVAYTDSHGREVITCGGVLPQSLIDKNCFTRAGIAALVEMGRIKPECVQENGTLKPPSNKLAKLPDKKKKGE